MSDEKIPAGTEPEDKDQDEVLAHSADEDEDQPASCGIQFG